MVKVKFKEWNCNVMLGKYGNGRTAIRLFDEHDGFPIATSSVNLVNENLEDDEVFIKSWSENEGMVEALMDANVIGSELRWVSIGRVEASVHKLLVS